MRCIFPRGLLLLLLLTALPVRAGPLQWPIDEAVIDQAAVLIQNIVVERGAARTDGVALAQPGAVSRFYGQRDFRPAWVDTDGVLIEAAELWQVLCRAAEEGLPRQDYPMAALEQHLFGVIDDPSQLAQLDLLLTDAFLLYSRNVRSGRFEPRSAGGNWFMPHERFDGSVVLAQALVQSTMTETLRALPPPHAGYHRLRTMLQQYLAVAERGGWSELSPGETLRLDSSGPRVLELRRRLRLSGDLDEVQPLEPERFDPALEEAVRRFQQRHGLLVDGSVGENTRAALNVPVEARIRQMEANMERWRWMPRQMEERYLLVNMAGYELDAFEAGVPVMNMRVIVGRDYRQTPVFASKVTSLVLNPHWYVPRSIFRDDILPQLRRDPARLQRLRMRVFSASGEVDAGSIDWTKVDGDTFPYTLRQEPGQHNSLGRIKFLLPNDYGIYLHDTPDRHLFDRSSRAYSSGCIRLEDPLDLAAYLLANPGRWDRAALEEAIDRGSPLGLTLPQPVPIYLTYWTAWINDAGVIQFRDDVYGRDRRLLILWGKNAT